MPVEQLERWLVFLDTAPPAIREYLRWLFWILVAVILLRLILKILLDAKFKEFYSLTRKGGVLVGQAGKTVLKGVADALEPAKPYPRTARFFTILFMLNSYAAAVTFAILGLIFAVLSVLSTTTDFWPRTIGMITTLVFFGFAWAFFNQAERERIALKNRTNS